jgi:hypothetical protein
MKITEIYSTNIEETKKNFIEKIEEVKSSELVNANEEKGIYLMRSKKGVFMTSINPNDIKNTCNKEAEYGFAVKCDCEFTEENIEKAKEIVCDKMCDFVRELIMNVPEKFFVIRDSVPTENGVDYFTVGCKMILPLPFTDEEFTEITK